jgi:hypothetical protein
MREPDLGDMFADVPGLRLPEEGKTQITGFMGVIGGGKDYNALKLQNAGWTRYAFAHAMRRVCEILFGWKNLFDDAEYEKFKKTFLYFTADGEEINGRIFLQRIGTEVGRKLLGENTWVNALALRVQREEPKKIVIPDVRFMNEAEWILSQGGEIFFCNYASDRYDSQNPHVSEHLAQQLLHLGWKDGDRVEQGDLDILKIAMGKKP